MDSIDKFGRHLTKAKIARYSNQPTLQANIDGCFDLKNKRLCNVQTPVEAEDCANRSYVDAKFKYVDEIIKNAKSPHLNQVRDLTQLQIDVNKLNRSISNNINQIADLTDNIHSVSSLVKTQTDRLDKVKQMLNEFRSELDSAVVKIKRSDLKTRIDKKV